MAIIAMTISACAWAAIYFFILGGSIFHKHKRKPYQQYEGGDQW